MLLHIGRIQAKQGAGEQMWFIPKAAARSGGQRGTVSRKLCNFYPHLHLETVFPALKLNICF